MRKRVALLVLLLITVPFVLAAQTTAQDARKVTVGVVVDGPWERMDEILGLFKTEAQALLADEFDLDFAETKFQIGDWTGEGIHRAVDQLLADPEVDILLTAGVICSDYVCHRTDLTKPVIAPFVINAQLQEIPFDGEASGVTNLCYITTSPNLAPTVRIFRELVTFDKLTFLLSRPIITAIPEAMDLLKNGMADEGIEAEFILVDSLADQILKSIPDETQAVHIGILHPISNNEMQRLIDGINERKLPSFAYQGISDVERGALAGMGEGVDFTRVARRTALNIQRILLGDEAGKIPVMISRGGKITINMATARLLDVSPGWGILTEAVLVNEQRAEISRKVTLQTTVREALTQNLDLAAKIEEVSAGKQTVKQARSTLLPQLDLSATGVIIDSDRAEASFGSQAERTITGSAGLTQLLFSEPAWSNFSIQRHLQTSREQELAQLRLDIVLNAATAYFNVLSAKTFERIQKDNVKLTRSNLELAQIRQTIGSSGPGEVYRWESQLATNRKDVVDAQAQRNVTEIALNRILNRPIEERFATEELDLEAYLEIVAGGSVTRYIGDKQSFRLFRAFMTEEALLNSPELKQLDAAIEAQERMLKSASQAFWLPQAALQGEVENVFSEEGAGTSNGLSSLLPAGSIPEANDLNWSLALNVSFPLFSGGGKFADHARARIELNRLQKQREALAQQIEQGVRSALHIMGASSAGIGFTRSAAEASQKNLDLVVDAYSRGVVSIIDLIDAQNAALVADLVAASAVYQFLIDLLNVQRAAGAFYQTATQEEREAWLNRLETFFEENRLGN